MQLPVPEAPPEALVVGADLAGACNLTQTRCFHEATQTCEHRTNMTTVEKPGEVVVVVKNNKAALDVAGTARTGRMWPTTQEIWGPAGWDLGIRNHFPTLDGPMLKHAPADDVDVRTVLEVGEVRQGGMARRSGDACDSLVLWGREAVGRLDHRKLERDRDRSGRASRSHTVVEGNWDLDLGASDLSVVRAHHKSPAGDSRVVHPAAEASARYSSNVDRPCVRARMLALAMKPV